MANEDSVEINYYVRRVKITRKIAKAFAKCLPEGRHAPLAGHRILHIIKDDPVFANIFTGVKDDVSYVADIAKIALVNYGFPIGSCRSGRFLIMNEEDRSCAIDFLETNNYDLGSYTDGGRRKNSNAFTFRYRALHDLEINGGKRPLPEEKYKQEDEEETEMAEKTQETVEETTKEKFVLSEDSCISFDEEMDFIVIRPSGINGNKEVIDSYEMPIDILSNHGDVIDAAMHIGQKPWMNKEMLIDFIKLASNKL